MLSNYQRIKDCFGLDRVNLVSFTPFDDFLKRNYKSELS